MTADARRRSPQGKGFCTKNEFVLLMLQRLDKIKAKDVAAAAAQFDRLDIDKSGVLSPDDVESQCVRWCRRVVASTMRCVSCDASLCVYV